MRVSRAPRVAFGTSAAAARSWSTAETPSKGPPPQRASRGDVILDYPGGPPVDAVYYTSEYAKNALRR